MIKDVHAKTNKKKLIQIFRQETNQKKTDINTVGLKARNSTKDKRRHYIMISESIIKENITILCKHLIKLS